MHPLAICLSSLSLKVSSAVRCASRDKALLSLQVAGQKGRPAFRPSFGQSHRDRPKLYDALGTR